MIQQQEVTYNKGAGGGERESERNEGHMRHFPPSQPVKACSQVSLSENGALIIIYQQEVGQLLSQSRLSQD